MAVSTEDGSAMRRLTGNNVRDDACRYEMVKLGFAFTDPLRALSHADMQDSRVDSAAFKNASESQHFALFSNVRPTRLYRATVAGIAALFAPATVSLPGTQCDCSD